MIWFMSNFLGSLQLPTLGHAKVTYTLWEFNWRGLRFGLHGNLLWKYGVMGSGTGRGRQI